MGLATVYGIVKQSGGYIWAESKLGRGSRFQTLLPRVLAAAGRRAAQPALGFSGAGETILLVEDNPAVRRMAEEVLGGAGYTVLVAPSGADALRTAAVHDGRVDLLLTDVVMPGMKGPELARDFVVRYPRIRVLYMSGYTEDAIGNHGFRRKTMRVLQKPFTHDTLLQGVREALGPVRRHE